MQVAPATASEEASLERRLEALREERERVCRWAEVESTSEEGWREQQHSQLVLQVRMGKSYNL